MAETVTSPLTAVAFLVSTKCGPFVELSDGSYRYLKPQWEQVPDPLRRDAPNREWVRRGIECGDVVRNGILSSTASPLVNRQISGDSPATTISPRQ